MAVVGLVDVGQELLWGVVLRAARRRAMYLPEILEPGRLVNGLPVFGRTTLSLSIVHQGYSRTDRVHQLRRPRMRIAMARRVKYGEVADQIIRAHQGVLLIPRQVAKIKEPEASI